MKIILFILLSVASLYPAYSKDNLYKNNLHKNNGAREVSLQRQLRCMVCSGESLAESDAKLAQDMRALIHDKITNGATDAEILKFLQSSYGDAILMEPPFTPSNLYLWGAPFILLSVGLLLAWKANFKQKSSK